MEISIIIAIILLAIIIVWNIEDDNNSRRPISAFLLMMITVTFTCLMIEYTNKDIPKALDVYQGKTTLEITYRDSIPVDSVVVFRK